MHARRAHRHIAFVKAYSYFVYACGVDVGTDMGLKCVCDSVGLDWDAVQPAADPQHPEYATLEREWRALTSANVSLLQPHSHWGVPCIKYRERVMVWGQDKLYLIEQYLAYEAEARETAGSKPAGEERGYVPEVIQLMQEQ